METERVVPPAQLAVGVPRSGGGLSPGQCLQKE